MELAWNNPAPNRTAYRAPAWEVTYKDGSSKVISAHELRAITNRKLDDGVKEATAVVATGPIPFCF